LFVQIPFFKAYYDFFWLMLFFLLCTYRLALWPDERQKLF